MTDNKKPAFEMSIDTRLIYQRLKEAKVGEVVSFKALAEALGRKVEGADASVQSAIRHLVSFDGVAFENVRGVGYQRLTDVEIVKSSESMRERIRRSARRVIKRLTCVQDFDRLPNDMKIKHNAAVSGFGAIAAMLTPGRMKKLEDQVEKASAQLPLAKTLEAFKG